MASQVDDEKNGQTKATASTIQRADPIVQPQNPERMQGAFLSIIYGAALPCIPVIIVTGIVLGIIFSKRVIPETGYPELDLQTPNAPHEGIIQWIEDWRTTGGSPAYYVEFNPSTLTTIAGWTAKVIPYLSSSIMALVAFFAARRILQESRERESQNLPTPHQLAILIQLLGGSGLQPLKDCIQYYRTSKERLVAPIPRAFLALSLVTLMGFLIPLADTWFGAATKPFVITQLSPQTNISSFGRGLNQSFCSTLGSNDAQGAWYPCNLDQVGSGSTAHYDLAGAAESCMTMNGVSDINAIANYSTSATEIFFFVINRGTDQTRDFSTKTLALSTQCEPMTRRCFPGAKVDAFNHTILDNTKFNCTSGFTGDLTSNGALAISNRRATGLPAVGIAFSPDKELSQMVGSNRSEMVYASHQNPLFFGVWAIGYPSASPDEPLSLLSDPEVFTDQDSDYVWMLNCSTGVYDLTYSWVNGSVHNFTTILADQDMGGIISTPFTMGIHMAQLALGLTSTMAGFSDNSSALAQMWSQLFSRYAISITTGATQPLPNDLEQLRNNNVGVTRVPLIPLFFLLGLKFLYALAAICLAIAAVQLTNPAETQSVKERLSVKGITASYFFDGLPTQQQEAVKNVEDLFMENKKKDEKQDVEGAGGAEGKTAPTKVGVVQTEMGGWQFVSLAADKVWKQVEPLVESTVVHDAKSGAFGRDGVIAADVYAVVK